MKIHNTPLLALIATLIFGAMQPVLADETNHIATLRNYVSIDTQADTQKIPKVVNSDVKQQRNYPMQPPVIPHSIRNYEINLNVNKCMSCHSRHRIESSQAPMVSVTHFMDRDGNFLAEISPRRYFCTQCHAIQLDTDPLVDNEFVDMHHLMDVKKSGSAKGHKE